MAQEKHPRRTPHDPDAELADARRGDRRAFSRLMEPYRRELVAYCYRLTGSLAESEDLAQEAFVRAFRALGAFEGRATPRAWLYRIAHNLCLNHVRRRPTWESWESLGDSAATGGEGPAGSEREDVRLGFVALVQSLPPRQRATLVLRDVLGWSAEETARILETTVPAVKNALARARQTLARQPHGGDPAEVRDLAAASPAAQALVAEWVDAFEKGNTPRMVALLTAGKTGYNKAESDKIHEQETPPAGRRERRRREESTDAQRQRS
ncbi:MAG: sigma-70 family RNA polymerase sigma factor [Armatimonadetes bacterium]|nr:sigma-70 family RNA polymerase sigma factor [Armatimonadota bacterium]